MTVGVLETLLFLFVVFLILGPRRIAGLGCSLGRGVRAFKLSIPIANRGSRYDTSSQPSGIEYALYTSLQ